MARKGNPGNSDVGARWTRPWETQHETVRSKRAGVTFDVSSRKKMNLEQTAFLLMKKKPPLNVFSFPPLS